MKPSRSFMIFIGILPLLLAGCASVNPWDRDNLAEYGMKPDRDPVTLTLRDHMWFSREACNGGRSIGGGGCGCN